MFFHRKTVRVTFVNGYQGFVYVENDSRRPPNRAPELNRIFLSYLEESLRYVDTLTYLPRGDHGSNLMYDICSSRIKRSFNAN